MSYKVVKRYGKGGFGAKPIAYAVVDSDGIEVKREIHEVNANKEARRLNAEARKNKPRHFTDV